MMTHTVVVQAAASRVVVVMPHLYIPCTESLKNFPHLRPAAAAALCMIPLVLAVAPPRLRLSGGTERLPKSTLPPMLTCIPVKESPDPEKVTDRQMLTVLLRKPCPPKAMQSHVSSWWMQIWAKQCLWARSVSVSSENNSDRTCVPSICRIAQTW